MKCWDLYVVNACNIGREPVDINTGQKRVFDFFLCLSVRYRHQGLEGGMDNINHVEGYRLMEDLWQQNQVIPS